MNYKIGLLRGDGIGPEIVDSAVRVLEKVGEMPLMQLPTEKITENHYGIYIAVVQTELEKCLHNKQLTNHTFSQEVLLKDAWKTL